MTTWKANACENEPRVIRCARTGFWDADLEQHVTKCRACAEAASIARLLNEIRRADEASARIPDSGLMWHRAQFLATRDASQRATQPISFVEHFAYAAAIVCLTAITVWQWHAIRNRLVAFGSGGMKSAFIWLSGRFAHFGSSVDISRLGTMPAESSVMFIACGAGFLALCALVAAYLVRSED